MERELTDRGVHSSCQGKGPLGARDRSCALSVGFSRLGMQVCHRQYFRTLRWSTAGDLDLPPSPQFLGPGFLVEMAGSTICSSSASCARLESRDLGGCKMSTTSQVSEAPPAHELLLGQMNGQTAAGGGEAGPYRVITR